MKSIVFTFALLFFLQSKAAPAPIPEEAPACQSAKEFITTFEYLRDNQDIAGSGDNSVKVASQVAAGCNGSAKRFIQTVNALKKVELPIKDVLNTAIEFSKKEDSNVEAFHQVFKRAYAEDGFDLDITTSVSLAKAIAIETAGNVKRSLQDFENIFEFCMKGKEVTLPKPACADLAKKVALSSKEKGPMASDAFLEGFRFLKGAAGLPLHEALKISQDFVQTSPQAFENFKLSYEYAMSDKGLKASKQQAIQFGKRMAQLTVSETKSSNSK